MQPASATTDPASSTSHPAMIRLFMALASAGFRRYATYRQAMVAAAFTNSVFGLLRCYVILAVAVSTGGQAAGYTTTQLATFVWGGQGLIGTVLLWAPFDLAERIRTGEIVSDLLRPVDLIWRELAGDLGRACYGALTRFVVPVTVGALVFHLYVPRAAATYLLFPLSVLLGTVVCFGCRYLVNLAAFWLLDARGPNIAWALASTILTGLVFPLDFLPARLADLLRVGLPMPSILQLPLDVLVERGSRSDRYGMIGLQAGWAVAMLAICWLVQRRAERRLVIQGG